MLRRPTHALPLRALVALLLIAALLSATSTPPPSVAANGPLAVRTPVGPPSFGLNSHLATRYPDPASMDVPAALVQELGVTWVREDFHWHRVQPRPDVWDWTFTDAAMRALLSRNIQVLGVLGPSVGWATANPNDPPNDVSYYAPNEDAFVAYAVGVVSRYRRYVKHWEIWNEPDHAIFWRPAPDPVAYTRMLIRTANAIRAIDPEAKILIGGINPFDTTFLRTVAENGGWGSFDILAIHPYVDPYSPEDGNLAAAADAVRALTQRYGTKPIWATEVGWSSGPGDRDRIGVTDQQLQASYLVRSMLALWQAGVEHSFWYSFKDDPGNPYGIIGLGNGRTDYQPRKPAFFALRTLNQQLSGATFVERRDLFEPRIVDSFSTVEGWRRTSQPNGVLRLSSTRARTGTTSAEISYNFTTRDNDYVVFERDQPIPLVGEPYALGIWVYGDGSTHHVRIWVRDAEGEVLQFHLGAIGPPGWHFLSTPIGIPVEPGNRIRGNGNGQVDFPAAIQAIVVDDMIDRMTGSGTIYLDDLTVISGHEIYDLRLRRGNADLDILWSPPGARAIINSRSATARHIHRDGNETTLTAANGQLTINLGPAPVYVWHQR